MAGAVVLVGALCVGISPATAQSVTDDGAGTQQDVGTNELISQSPEGEPGIGVDGQYEAISGDGNLVVFTAKSTNLTPDKPQGGYNVFLRNRATGQTILIDQPLDGGVPQPSGRYPVTVSVDGRYVAFTSRADDLVRRDRNHAPDLFVYDVASGRIKLASRAFNGGQANGTSLAPAFSADRRYLAFHSAATNLVPDDTNETTDIFVLDIATRTTTIVSVSSTGEPSDAISFYPSLSADGRYIVYQSAASTLVPGLPPQHSFSSRVFLYDQVTAETTLIDRLPDGSPTDDRSGYASISLDGRFISYDSDSPGLVPDDDNDEIDVFLYDRQTDTTTLVSAAPDGTPAAGRSQMTSISGDGRYVAYFSNADDLTGDDPTTYGAFVWDRVTGETTYASPTVSGDAAAGYAWYVHISSNGTSVVYTSNKNGLVANDNDGTDDVFVYRLN